MLHCYAALQELKACLYTDRAAQVAGGLPVGQVEVPRGEHGGGEGEQLVVPHEAGIAVALQISQFV